MDLRDELEMCTSISCICDPTEPRVDGASRSFEFHASPGMQLGNLDKPQIADFEAGGQKIFENDASLGMHCVSLGKLQTSDVQAILSGMADNAAW